MIQQSEPEIIDKAWGRIGRSPWDQMAWFVNLSNIDLASLSPGDLLNWSDEFVAISTSASSVISTAPSRNVKRGWQPKHRTQPPLQPPTLQQMRQVQSLLGLYLNALADGQTIDIETAPVGEITRFRKTDAQEEQAGAPRYDVQYTELRRSMANLYFPRLLWRMTHLLKQFANTIRRCPHCHRVFIQLRRNRNYCGKACYTVAGMQRLRAEKKSQGQRKTKRKKQGLTAAPSKGEERHGKKRR
jgi:hypothetical protein